MEIQFLGAAGTVTGSKYLVKVGKQRILIDVGLFQGSREWRSKNWDSPPFDPAEITAVLLTHAHVDHVGMLPRFRALGLNCPVYATSATRALVEILLPDTGKLQEEEALFRAEGGRTRHLPPLPLFTEQQAIESLRLIRDVEFDVQVQVAPGITAQWTRTGHILGAGAITLRGANQSITFSGDVGRYGVPILTDPAALDFGDLLLIESTYGDRAHGDIDPATLLGECVRRTAARGGVVLIPAFAVGRTQTLLFYLRELKERRAIPDIPIIVDSPMASDATSVYSRFPSCYDEESLGLLRAGRRPFFPSKLGFTKGVAESKRLNGIDQPMVIISGSGMLNGGRILHHLRHRIGNPRNTLLFVGYQPEGSRGAWLKSGATSMQLFHEEIPVRAEIAEISGLSAHGDASELLRWCRGSRTTPSRIAIVHGERSAAEGLSARLFKELGWGAEIPAYRDVWRL